MAAKLSIWGEVLLAFVYSDSRVAYWEARYEGTSNRQTAGSVRLFIYFAKMNN